MADMSASAEPPRTPPPIPVRSHLQKGSAYQLKLRAILSEASSTSSVPVFAPPLVEEIDGGLIETHRRQISAVVHGKRTHDNVHHLSWDNWKGIDVQDEKRGTSEHSYECCMRLTGPEVSHDDRLEPLRPEQPSEISMTPDAIDQYFSEHDTSLVEDADTLSHTAPAQQGSHDGTMTHSTHLDCADGHSPSTHQNSENMDSRVPAWLTRGFSSPILNAADSPREANRDYNCTLPLRPVPLSLFPPTSPSTGRREYTPLGANFPRPSCPMSPLKNGRDAYGNYISSSAQDYLATQSVSTSPDIRSNMRGQDSGIKVPSSPAVRLRGGGWNDLKPLWKTANAEKLRQESDTAPLKTSVENEELPRDNTAVNDSGRRPPRSVRSHFSGPRFGKEPKTPGHILRKPFAIHNGQQDDHLGDQNIGQRPGTQHSDSTGGSSERRARVDAILNNHFGPQPPLMVSIPRPSRSNAKHTFESQNQKEIAIAIRSPETNPKDEKRWNKKGLSPPPQSPLSHPTRHLGPEPVSYEIFDESDDDSLRAPSIMSANTVDDQLINLPGLKSSNAYRKVERDREIRRIQEQRRLHEEADRRRKEGLRHTEEAQKEELDRSANLSNDNVAAPMRERQLHRYELPQMATVDEQYRLSTSIPAPNSHQGGVVPVNIHQPRKNWHHQNYTIGYPSTMPVPKAATPPVVSKGQNSLRNVLAKAGKFGRFILAVSSDPDLKTYSQRHSPGEHIHVERRLSGMSADRSGWPIKDPQITGFYNITPAANLNNESNADIEGPETSRSGFTRSRKPKNDNSEQKDMEEMGSGGTVVKDFGSRNTDEVSGKTFNMDLYGNPFTMPAQSHNLCLSRSRVKATKESPSNTQVTNFFGAPATHLELTEYNNPTSMQPQSLGYTRRRRRAGIFTPPMPETILSQSDSSEAVYTRRNDGEIQSSNPGDDYPCHMHHNNSYGAARPNRMTEKWVDGIVTNQDINTNTIASMRGGDGSNDKASSTDSSQAPQQPSFTSALALSPAATASCPHPSLEQGTTSTEVATTTSATQVSIVRSSFSSDSEGKTKTKLRLKKKKREKRAKGNVWRNEDKALAMATAMHSR